MWCDSRSISHWLPAAAIVLGSFLLFAIEPLAGKVLLPWFGGAPAVWLVCMLFFQAALLAGYGYAHLVSSRLAPRHQSALHLLVLAASMLWLPPLMSARWQPAGIDLPAAQILGRLVIMIGGPFFVVATTAPLMQAWYCRLSEGGRSPYRLYALSNIGALLALFSYPLWIEPLLTVRVQAWSWSVLYAGYAVLAGAAAVAVRRVPPLAPSFEAGSTVSFGRQLLWFVAPFVGSVLLLAVTNEMTQDVAVVPFLWIVPLAIYLATFVLCFEGSGWYLRRYYLPLCLVSIVLLHGTIWIADSDNVLRDTVIWCATLFAFCMVCHGETERSKPVPRLLTRFYLLIAAGGAAGGIFMGFGAPHLFHEYRELQWAMAAALAIPALPILRPLPLRASARVVVLVLWLAGAAATGLYLEARVRGKPDYTIAAGRNFYGVLHVTEFGKGQSNHLRRMRHGRIIHGLQFMDPQLASMHIGYMGSRSGPSLGIFYSGKTSGRRFGVIGLGTGTVAAYANEGDLVRFYEINPLVIRYAHEYFTYLRDSKAPISIVEGDARLSLAREEPQQFDFLFLDAFSGDAPPVHLLTREAFELYLKHLKPDGVIFAHISNRFVDFAPLLWEMADHFKMQAALIESKGEPEWGIFSASWMLMTYNEDILSGTELAQAATPRYPAAVPLWTDDYSSLLPLLNAAPMRRGE